MAVRLISLVLLLKFTPLEFETFARARPVFLVEVKIYSVGV